MNRTSIRQAINLRMAMTAVKNGVIVSFGVLYADVSGVDIAAGHTRTVPVVVGVYDCKARHDHPAAAPELIASGGYAFVVAVFFYGRSTPTMTPLVQAEVSADGRVIPA